MENDRANASLFLSGHNSIGYNGDKAGLIMLYSILQFP